MKKTKALFVLLVLFPLFASADIILLKNGEKIENVSTWEEDGQVKCYRFGSLISYLKENVKGIETAPVSSPFRAKARDPIHPPGTSVSPNSSPREDPVGQFDVTKVLDGDTFNAQGHGIEIKARLVGIDAPEKANKRRQRPGQPYSEAAREYLSERILNKTVGIRGYGMGAYNRQLVEVFSDGKNINLELVRSGLAETYQGKAPKGFDPAPYQKAERMAMKLRKGIWTLGHDYVSPKKWRGTH